MASVTIRVNYNRAYMHKTYKNLAKMQQELDKGTTSLLNATISYPRWSVQVPPRAAYSTDMFHTSASATGPHNPSAKQARMGI